MGNTLTCVYCGMAYPEGTPPNGAQILTDHIKVCEKHPLREAEDKILKLRTALIGLVGASSKDEIEGIARVLDSIVPDGPDKDASLFAIRVLIETEDGVQ